MTTKHTQYTTIYVVVAKVGARKAPFYGTGWQFHSVHENYGTALDSANGWCRQGGKSCAAIFSWSQVSGFEPASLVGEDIGSHEAINAPKIIPYMAVEHYHEMMRNVAEQVTGREFPVGSVRSPLDVADATAAAADDAAAEKLAAGLCYPVESGEPPHSWRCLGCSRKVEANTGPKSRLCPPCQENVRRNPDSYVAT